MKSSSVWACSVTILAMWSGFQVGPAWVFWPPGGSPPEAACRAYPMSLPAVSPPRAGDTGDAPRVGGDPPRDVGECPEVAGGRVRLGPSLVQGHVVACPGGLGVRLRVFGQGLY